MVCDVTVTALYSLHTKTLLVCYSIVCCGLVFSTFCGFVPLQVCFDRSKFGFVKRGRQKISLNLGLHPFGP